MPHQSDLFTALAEDYGRYRPGYPAAIVEELIRLCGMTPEWTIADIGSGTGNLARLFLQAGHEVFAVEPNRWMRAIAERNLRGHARFHSANGSAESIPLAENSVDLICVGQALQWFDVVRAKREFRRVLRSNGWVVVLWNDHAANPSAFMRDYEAFTHIAASTASPACRAAPGLSSGLELLFDGCATRYAEFSHSQYFDLEGLFGRARSSGYFQQCASDTTMVAAQLTDLFEKHQADGKVKMPYIAKMTVAQLEGIAT